MVGITRVLKYPEMTVVGIHCSPFEATFMRIKYLIHFKCGIFNECEVVIQKEFVCRILFIILYIYQDKQTFYLAFYLAYVKS